MMHEIAKSQLHTLYYIYTLKLENNSADTYCITKSKKSAMSSRYHSGKEANAGGISAGNGSFNL